MRLGVGGFDGADVAAFHIRYHRQGELFGREDQVPVYLHPGGAEPLEERRLELYGCGVGLHGLEDTGAEPQGGVGLGQGAQPLREACRDRVDPGDEHAVLAAGGFY